jgi:hypothetical protein
MEFNCDMGNRKFILLVSSLILLIFVACKKDSDLETEEQVDNSESTVTETQSGNASDHENAADYVWESSSVIPVVFNGSSITVSSSGATASGSKLTITSAGNYSFSGSLTDGQIVVNTTDAATVRLILNGVTIHSSTSAPIYIKSSTKTVIVLADNTTNTLSDGTSYTYDVVADEEPNATIFSKSDLSIYGGGLLVVTANFNDAINTKDGLVINSGTLNLTAADDGIRGKDYLVVRDATITVNASGDGLKSDNEDDTDKGYILIEKGTFAITAGGDGINAETDVLIESGKFTLKTGGGSSQTISSTLSAKAIKAKASLIIDDGTFVINSADDALHSNGSIAVNGGTFTISSGDDAVHADSALGISGGTILITKCYEGLESKTITINKGDIRLTASDDGINGSDGTSTTTGGGFGGGSTSSGNAYFYMNGGYVFVNAGGDGVDVNGSIAMTGGTLIVNGPTDNGNGPLDYDGTFKITGGTILAVGSSGMAQAPGTSSTQYSVLLNLSSAKTAGTLVHFQTSDGTELFTFAPAKKYQSIAYSSSQISNGTSIDVYFGGTSTGTLTDGMYSGGTYSGGTKYTTITVSGITTTLTR